MAKKDEECCNDEPVDVSSVNLFNGIKKKKRKGWSIRMNEIQPIIENEPNDVSAFFKKNRFIPWSGTDQNSSHNILTKVIDFKQLSPTHGACIESRKTWAFGSKIDFVGNYDPEFNLGETELTPEQKITYRDFLKSIDLGDSVNWMDIRCNASEDYDSTGNVWFEIVLNENFGEKKAGIYRKDSRECLYYPEEDGTISVGISSHWFNEAKLKKDPPKILPLFPNFHQYPDGSMRSILHVKNGSYKFYGRPKSFASLIDQHNEVQNRTYQAKQLNSGFIGHTIIEIEGDESTGDVFGEDGKSNDEGFENFVQQAEENYTAKGDNPTSVIVSERPFGASPMKVHNIPANTSHQYFEGMERMSRQNIIMTHDWSEMILKMDGSTGFSQNAHISIFKIKSVTSIKALQTAIDGPINKMVDYIREWMGEESLKGIGQKSVSPIQDLIEELEDKGDEVKLEDNVD